MDEEQRSEETPKTDSGAESTPTIQDTQTQATQTPGSGQDEDRKHFRWGLTQYELISVIIQGSIFISAFIYMIFASLQWHAMRETLQVSKESIEFSKDSVEVSKRPWVVLTRVENDAPFAMEREMKVTDFSVRHPKRPSKRASG